METNSSYYIINNLLSRKTVNRSNEEKWFFINDRKIIFSKKYENCITVIKVNDLENVITETRQTRTQLT